MNQPSLWERLAERQQSPTRPAPKTNDVARAAHDVAHDVAQDAAQDVAHVAQDAASSRLIGRRYRLAGRIGRGKFGPIYAATDEGRRDLGVEARVAVQLIDERYARDTRMAAELTSAYAVLSASVHPNIVRTIDFVRDGRNLFLVTELLEGLSLDAVLDEVAPEPLPFEESAAVMAAVGDALRNLHAKGFVYGPLKPKNVFVTFKYGIKLLDVAPISPPASAPYYVEDVGKQVVSRHSSDDVFELACLAYEMLSGRHPFNENSPIEAQRAGLEPQRLSSLDQRQWEAIARGLALERSERTHTIQRFLEELAIKGTERIRTTQSASQSAAPSRGASPSRTWEASQDSTGELRVYDTLPLEPMQRRRLSVAAIARPLFGVAVVAALGTFAMLYYGDLRDGAADLMALVEQQRPVTPPATSDNPNPVARDAPEATSAVTPPSGSESAGPSTGAEPPTGVGPSTGAGPARSSAPAASGPTTPAPSSTPSTSPGPSVSSTTPAPSPVPTQNPSRPPSSASPGVTPSASPPSTASTTAPSQSPTPSLSAEVPRERTTPATGPGQPSSSASNAPPAMPLGVPAETAPVATRPAAQGGPSSPSSVAPADASPAPRVSGADASLERSRSTGAEKTALTPPVEFPFAFASATITASEKDKLVRVEVRRLGSTEAAGSVVWWLGNATATEDDDYGKLGQHSEYFARGEESRTLYIPLIDDKDPERTESFYVYLGRYSSQKKHLDALATVRVDIVDDD